MKELVCGYCDAGAVMVVCSDGSYVCPSCCQHIRPGRVTWTAANLGKLRIVPNTLREMVEA